MIDNPLFADWDTPFGMAPSQPHPAGGSPAFECDMAEQLAEIAAIVALTEPVHNLDAGDISPRAIG